MTTNSPRKIRPAQEYIYTRSGLALHPSKRFDPGDIRTCDIAGSLGRIYRYNGHSDITVLRHSMAVAELVLQATRSEAAYYHALLHDAHEAYTQDITVPLKRFVDTDKYRSLASKFQRSILARYGIPAIPAGQSRIVKYVDLMVVQFEMMISGLTGPAINYDLSLGILPQIKAAYRLNECDEEREVLFRQILESANDRFTHQRS